MNRFVFAVAIALVLASCGGKDTMASKSAAAYREAVAKPAPVEMDHSAHAMTPDAHATHGAATEHAEHGAPAAAHASHAAAKPDAHAGMQHGSSAPATMDHSQMDHSQHGAMQQTAPATMDHSQHGAMQQAAPDPHAGHGTTTPAAGPASVHGAHSNAVAVPPHSIEVPRANSEMGRLKPAATLKQDDFDAPAPSAVAESQKKGH